MKKTLKIAGIVVGLLVAGVAVFVTTAKPKARGVTDLKVEITPERLARGTYLVEHVVNCIACHSKVDVNSYALGFDGPPGQGLSACFPVEMAMPGKICPPNITPHPEKGIGKYTDDEIMRAFREGVKRDGNAIFPIMPYLDYSHISDQDAQAIVAYLRSLEPVDNDVPETKVDFPVSFFITLDPKPIEKPVPHPDESNELEWGKYLSDISGCKECHMQYDETVHPIPGTEFGGGRVFGFPWGDVVTPNITTHETGRLPETREAFIGLFKSFSDAEAVHQPIKNGRGTVMPWVEFSGMTEKDLGAIWAYIRTVPPQDNAVEKWPNQTQ